MEKFEVCTVSKMFPKHLMERAGLLRYSEKEKIRIVIEYDPESGEGFMNVFEQMTTRQFRAVD